MCTCRKKGIPEHLWKKDQENVQDFEQTEELYRRFNVALPLNHDYVKFSAEVFQLNDDSYNRSKFCKSHLDVLYNNDGRYYENYGVLSLEVNKITNNFKTLLNGVEKEIEIIPVHDCVECNYAHTILQIKVDGEFPRNPKPARQVRKAIRYELASNFKILKNITVEVNDDQAD